MALPSLWLEDFGIFSLPSVWPQLAPLSIPGIKQELGTWVNEWYCLTLSSFAQTSPSPLFISPLGKSYYKLCLSLTFFILSVWGKQIHMDRSVLTPLPCIIKAVVDMLSIPGVGLFLWKTQGKKRKIETGRGMFHFSFWPHIPSLPHWTFGCLPPLFCCSKRLSLGKGKVGIGLALGFIAMGEGICFQGQDQASLCVWLRYRISGESEGQWWWRPVCRAEPAGIWRGHIQSENWELCPAWALMVLSPGSVNPVICCSWPCCLSACGQWYLWKTFQTWGQCRAGHFGGIRMQFISAALVPCGSLWGLSQLFRNPLSSIHR